jgi:ketosteroid isomerase-like protein
MTSAAAMAALIALLVTAGCASTGEHAASNMIPDAIKSVAHAQEAAWNRGDLEGFMSKGYVRSEQLTFFSGGSVTHGYDDMLARYKKSYQSEGKEMVKLSFTNLEVLPFDMQHAALRGHWQLHFEKQKDVGGLFTLLFVRTSDGWRIIHDHTSVDSPK